MAVRVLHMRLMPDKSQTEKIDRTIDCCRYIYNHMLERNSKAYDRRKQHLNYNAMQNLLPVMKGYQPWLKDADAKALQSACRRLDNAFQRFFKNRVDIRCSTANVKKSKAIQPDKRQPLISRMVR